VTGDWRQLHSVSFMIGAACQVVLGWSNREGEIGSACEIWGEEVKCTHGFGRENWKRAVARPRHKWEDIVKIELKRIRIIGNGLDWSGWGLGRVVGCWEYGNEPSGVIKYGEYFNWLRNCQLFKKNHASCSSVRQLVCLSGLQFIYIF
jgi:hypothetical protein